MTGKSEKKFLSGGYVSFSSANVSVDLNGFLRTTEGKETVLKVSKSKGKDAASVATKKKESSREMKNESESVQPRSRSAA